MILVLESGELRRFVQEHVYVYSNARSISSRGAIGLHTLGSDCQWRRPSENKLRHWTVPQHIAHLQRG